MFKKKKEKANRRAQFVTRGPLARQTPDSAVRRAVHRPEAMHPPGSLREQVCQDVTEELHPRGQRCWRLTPSPDPTVSVLTTAADNSRQFVVWCFDQDKQVVGRHGCFKA